MGSFAISQDRQAAVSFRLFEMYLRIVWTKYQSKLNPKIHCNAIE